MKFTLGIANEVFLLVLVAFTTLVYAQPAIVVQPKDQFVDEGTNAVFRVSARGVESLAYQWRFGEAELIGATNALLTLTNVRPADASGYSAVVSDANGSVTSRVARLDINIILPHGFSAIRGPESGTVSLQLSGNASLFFQPYYDLHLIDASSNLVEWTPLAAIVRTNSLTNQVSFADTNISGSAQRFYRTPTNHLITALAKPTGPYAVGRITRLVTDPARTNRYRISTNSSFMITVWYPAEAKAGVLPAPYIDPQLAAPLSMPSVGSLGDNSNRLARLVAHALPEVAMARGEPSYPVVLHSHGYSFHRQESSEKMEELASHGFVAVGIDHIDCRTTVFPNGRALRGVFSTSVSDSDLIQPVIGRLADDRFVVGELVRLNESDPVLAGRLDMSRLGGMGWSLGSSDIGEAARTDERFKAVFMLDGYLQGANDLVRLGLKKPLLGMYQEGQSQRSLFNKATQDAYFCQVRGADHFTFKDLTESYLATQTPRRAAEAIRACMLSFFNKYLKGQDDHLLDNPTKRFPALFNFAKK